MKTEVALQVAHRLIARDVAIRAADRCAPWGSVRRIIDYVVEQQLLSDAVVGGWLCTVADGADTWVSRRLLQTVRALLDAGDQDQSHSLYRRILGLDDPARWEKLAPDLAEDSMLVAAGFEPILGRPGLLSSCPASWGRTACAILGRVVVEHQRRDWPQHLHFMAEVSEMWGEPFDSEQPFAVEYDDRPSLWYFSRDSSHAPRRRLAAAVEQGVREAAHLPDASAFQLLADELVRQRFAIGIGLLLATLLDCLQGKIVQLSWHATEVARLLTLDAVQEHVSLADFRQLLRRVLPRPDDATAEAVADVIRRSGRSEPARVHELADLVTWGILQQEEAAQVAAAAVADELEPPSDPRARALMGQAEVSWLHPAMLGKNWPHPEDEEAIHLLAGSHQEAGPDEPLEVVEQYLGRRLDALQHVLGREACDADGWVGEILGWCRHTLRVLRTCQRKRLPRTLEHDEPTGNEWESLLDARAPWWRGRVEAALRTIGGPVPDYHAQEHPRDLTWSSSDPVYQSLAYLDEVLAADGDGPFPALRRRLEEALDAAWARWPPFTRATALGVLRPWYWRNLAKLRAWVSRLAAEETDALVATHAVDQLLRIGGPDFADTVERFVRRAATLEDCGQTVNRIGQAVGHAVLRHRGGGQAGEGLEQLASLYVRVQEAPPADRRTQEEFIQGTLWGAGEYLKETARLTDAHAAVLVALVQWVVSQWPFCTESSEDGDRFPLHALMLGLQQQWPPGTRHRLFDDFAEPFLRVVREGTLADFCWFHHEITSLLRGESRPSQDAVAGPIIAGEMSDDLLLRFCEASAERVVSWHVAKKTTRDAGWMSALWGQETADLIRAVVDAGSDRDHLRRELPAVIDRLADAGCTATAAELRLYLRRS